MGILRLLLWRLYQRAYGLAFLLLGPFFARRRGFEHYRTTLRGRLARDLGPPDGVDRLWIHAVSVGEVEVAATLARALPPDLPIVVTTVTPTGQERARALFATRRDAGTAEVAYLPFDLGPTLAIFERRFRPRAVVLVEGDYWPLMLSRLAERGVPVAVVNGRLSDRAFRRQQPLGVVNRLLHAAVWRFGVQTDEDRRRLIDLGVEASRVTVTGNLKFDTPRPDPRADLGAWLDRLADGRPILVAGSTMGAERAPGTHADEEEPLLDALDKVGSDRALLVLAPRHPERFDAVAARLDARGLTYRRRSRTTLDGEPSPSADASVDERPDVVLLDSLGELAAVYGLGDGAFIGGTMVPTGGHNPLEPARWGVPIVVGPSMHNFREMAEHFDTGNAWARATETGELAAVWTSWLDEPDAARQLGTRGLQLVERHRGAVDRSVTMLEPLLRAVPPTSRRS
ncbi:MAG: 3-deoxy-D-manno-octulosonic acid transferase [Acidobacteriota bacterium]